MSPRLFSTISLCCAALCLLSHCGKETASPKAEGEALAVVAGQSITADDLVREAEWRRSNKQAVPEAEALLKDMVNRLALVERAKQTGLDAEPDTKRRIEGLLIARLREKELDSSLAKVDVSDEELAASYEARREEFSRKGLERFSILFQAAQPKMSDERRTEARARLEDAIALSGAKPAAGGRGPAASGFGSVAATHSDDQATRYRGGDIGWLETGAEQSRWPAAVLDVGRALEKGAQSGIIEAADGFYVIMKTDERPGGVRPLEEISERLRQGLIREKRLAIEERFVADALKLSKVELNTAAARKVTLPVSKPPTDPSAEPPGFPGVSSPAANR